MGFMCKLGSRRQIDCRLRDPDTQVLENVNALAETEQEALPVHNTLAHYFGHVGPSAFAALCAQMVRSLIRSRVFDKERLERTYVVAIDGTGLLSFTRRHCDDCLVRKHDTYTSYQHHVLAAKLVTSSGLAMPMGSQFIENRDRPANDRASAEQCKQDCELNAFKRLAKQLKKDFPQTRLCLAGDSLYACGPVMSICEKHRWKYVFTFLEGSLRALWKEFQAHLKLLPQNVRRLTRPGGVHLELRWANNLPFTDSYGVEHTCSAIECIETKNGETNRFAWITNFTLAHSNIFDIAQKGGRNRWKIENHGFNMQKNGGYNLEHAYGLNGEVLKCFYIFLQIAHLIMQLVEKGSVLRRAVKRHGKSVLAVYGSVRNIARSFLDCLRYGKIPDEATNPTRSIQIRFDTS